jgi:alkylation response protein AidB-like acyl-CoA dehydrogenase
VLRGDRRFPGARAPDGRHAHKSEPAQRARAVSTAKATIGRAARFMGQNAVQLRGAICMTEEPAIGPYFKRLTAVDYEFGSTDAHVARCARLTRP